MGVTREHAVDRRGERIGISGLRIGVSGLEVGVRATFPSTLRKEAARGRERGRGREAMGEGERDK